jgi:hypothetical protein
VSWRRQTDPVKIDDWDYHETAAEEAGYPAEHGFTHIGLFLAWLIRHDLFADDYVVAAGRVEKVRDGEWAGSGLRDDVDGKLINDMLTAEGAAFSTARYGAYLRAFDETFADRPDYSVPDDGAHRSISRSITTPGDREGPGWRRQPRDRSISRAITALGDPSAACHGAISPDRSRYRALAARGDPERPRHDGMETIPDRPRAFRSSRDARPCR